MLNSCVCLCVWQNYYVTVIASTNAGDVTVSSDGVTVIQTDENEAGITIKDGPGCSSDGMLIPTICPIMLYTMVPW